MNRTRRTFMILIAAAAAISMVSVVSAAEWGSLKGRFVVDGIPPQPNALIVTKDQFCIDKKPMDESVVVGDDGSLANAVVYVRLGRREKIDIYPDYAASSSEPVELDNLGCHFVPHVTLVRAGQPILLRNSDPVGHNTNVGSFNQIIPADGGTSTKIDRSTPLPISVTCNIHPFMKGYVLVQDHPYMAASSEDGTFEIKNLPAGKHEFQFWHETGPLKGVTFDGGTTDRRGRVELTIQAGDTLDVGEVKVPAAALAAGR